MKNYFLNDHTALVKIIIQYHSFLLKECHLPFKPEKVFSSGQLKHTWVAPLSLSFMFLYAKIKVTKFHKYSTESVIYRLSSHVSCTNLPKIKTYVFTTTRVISKFQFIYDWRLLYVLVFVWVKWTQKSWLESASFYTTSR